VLSVRGLSKRFAGVRALDDVMFEVHTGKVVALIGENGAGKSTLVKILTGIYQPDDGEIRLDGHIVSFANAHDAAEAGISAIHQESVLFDDLTVAENIFVGHQPRSNRFGLIDWAAMNRRAKSLLDEIGVGIGPEILVKTLSVAERHLVSLAKALSMDAKVLIFDEPTAALSQHEIRHLYGIIGRLRDAGKGIVFISHKFDEIFAIANRYTVFRDGRFVGDGDIADVTEQALVSQMVGRTLSEIYPKAESAIGDTVLEVDGLSHETEFDDISFSLRRGEILGFYGLVGAGRTEVMEAIFGLKGTSAGSIKLNGRQIQIVSPVAAVEAGIAYVPEDRQAHGVILPLSVRHNLSLPSLKRLSNGPFLNRPHERQLASEYGERLSIKAASWEQAVAELSGGNQQKVVISKWLATEPRIIILDEPTKGIDVGSKAAVHRFMGDLVQAGLAVILVTSELEEVLGIADNIVVMHRGRVRGRFTREEASAETIMRSAADAA